MVWLKNVSDSYHHGVHGRVARLQYPHRRTPPLPLSSCLGFPFEESIRVPLIIQDPRMPKSKIGKRNEDFTLNIDLAPTLLSAAQIPVPQGMQGKDMSTLYMDNNNGESTKSKDNNNLRRVGDDHTNEDSTWRDEFYYEWFTGDKQNIPASLALVRRDSKYILWPDYDYEQLFRLDNDPFEEKDLFKSQLKTNQQLLDTMKTRMAELKLQAASGRPM